MPAQSSNQMNFEVDDLKMMRGFAFGLAASAGARQLLLIDGPMGAGKTQFTRFVLEAFGGKETTSPSFAIHNSYQTARGAIEHVDLFRVENEDDLESTGFWDLFLSAEGFVIVEWADRLIEFGLSKNLPRTWPTTKIRFSVTDTQSECRSVSVTHE